MSENCSRSKNKRSVVRHGSILLTVMGLVGLLVILTGALIRIVSHRKTGSYRYSQRVKLRWMANGELDALIARLENGAELLKERKYTIQTENGSIVVSVKKGDDFGRRYLLKAVASSGSFSRASERGIEAFFPSDYAITVETNWSVLSRYIPTVLSGRVYVNGSCAIAVTDSGPLELVGSRQGRKPLWTVFGGFRPLSFDGVGLLSLFRANSLPFASGLPYSKPDKGVLLAGKEAIRYRSGLLDEVKDILPGKPFRFPPFKMVYSSLLAQSEPQFRFLNGDRGSLKSVMIPNSKLLAKDLIGVGNGSSFIFPYTPRARKIQQIYFKKVRNGQPLDSIRIDPVADADSIGFRFFNARMGRLYLPAGSSKVYLQLQKDAYSSLGRVQYGTINRSYCSVDHPFAKFYLDTISELQPYIEGTHYRVDYLHKEIEFLDSDLIAKYYSFLSERGDGQKLGFTVPLSLRYKYVYVNGKLDEGVKREGETLFFSTPPPNNALIGFLVKEPRLYGLRQVPPAGVGVFVDKIVRALRVDLGQMQHYPSKGLIVSDQPLYVTGSASFPVTIVSSKDVYIDNINRSADDPKPVGIVSGKAVWVHNVTMKSNINKRVYIFSQADRLYTTTMGSPKSVVNKSYLKGVGIVVGSVHLAGQIENSYNRYPAGIRRPESHIFSREPFFSVQYRYDPYFSDPRNLPPGVHPLVRLVWWKP